MRKNLVIPIVLFLASCDAPHASRGEIQGTNYRVRTGDSLFSIADRAYGDGKAWVHLWEANQWLDPDRLRTGEIIHIPVREDWWDEGSSGQAFALETGARTDHGEEDDGAPAAAPGRSRTRSSNPGSGNSQGLTVFRNLATNVSARTLFGLPLQKVLLYLFACFFLHAIFQAVLVWLAANITFVKDASFKKSLKAVFLTESLTFSTLVVLAGVAILMLYLGTEPGEGGGSGQLFPAMEGFLRSPTGMGVAGLSVMTLYVILSLRFLPQVFGVPTGRAMTLMALAILVPHLVGMYLVGQRTGMIR